MAEYIDRELFIKSLNERKMSLNKHNLGNVQYIKELIDLNRMICEVKSFPKSDVAPVKRGEWVKSDALNHRCTNCHKSVANGFLKSFNFCPNCGADMRKE